MSQFKYHLLESPFADLYPHRPLSVLFPGLILLPAPPAAMIILAFCIAVVCCYLFSIPSGPTDSMKSGIFLLIFICLAALGHSCSMRDLSSLLQHARSLVATCEILIP